MLKTILIAVSLRSSRAGAPSLPVSQPKQNHGRCYPCHHVYSTGPHLQSIVRGCTKSSGLPVHDQSLEGDASCWSGFRSPVYLLFHGSVINCVLRPAGYEPLSLEKTSDVYIWLCIHVTTTGKKKVVVGTLCKMSAQSETPALAIAINSKNHGKEISNLTKCCHLSMFMMSLLS